MTTIEYTLNIYDESIELTCDECGHVNHWASGIELDEVAVTAADHHMEFHSVK